MSEVSILVAGIGNIFHGDDGFGVELARRLARRDQPGGVRVVDYGIRGRDLAYALLDDLDGLILLDAAPRGKPPGSLCVIEPDPGELDGLDVSGPAPDSHGMNPLEVFRMLRILGGRPPRTLIVGCEPGPIDLEREDDAGLSDPVARALDDAVALAEFAIARMLHDRRSVPHA